ncbi:E3 binding domain-containing protein, partial [Streptomyces hainanensis]|uniref:E3 binding domain-containing protein n=1 Tax=Streptomyces hainanensis TaxID=402648 RepID=UPI001FB68DEA
MTEVPGNVFLLPDLGEGLTSAEVVRWLVDVGDTVTVDQPVVEVETAKSVVELPCPYEGVVAARHGAPGEELPVGAELLRLHDEPASSSGPVLVGYGTAPGGAPQPTAPAPAPAAVPVPVPASFTGTAVAVVSPLVRRLARERGVDLHTVTGSGPGGLIMRADVLNASPHEGAAGTGPAPVPGTGLAGSAGLAVGPPAGSGAGSAGDPQGLPAPAGAVSAGGEAASGTRLAGSAAAGGLGAGGPVVSAVGGSPGGEAASGAGPAPVPGTGPAGSAGLAVGPPAGSGAGSAGDPQGLPAPAVGGVVGMRGVAWVMA